LNRWNLTAAESKAFGEACGLCFLALANAAVVWGESFSIGLEIKAFRPFPVPHFFNNLN
jgi:hypothetical protein